MHTIDLLKGKGIPEKTTLRGVAIVIFGVLVPCFVAAGMLYEYLRYKAIIPILTEAVVKEQVKIDKLSAAVKLNETLETNKKLITERLLEVSSCVDKYVQWSPVLVTLASNMPDNMVLTALTANRKNVRKMIPQENDPNKTVGVAVPTRTLALNISGSPEHNPKM